MSEAKQVKVRRVPVTIDGTEYVWIHVDGERCMELRRLEDEHKFGYVNIESYVTKQGGENRTSFKTIACCSVGNNRPIEFEGSEVGKAVDDVERRVDSFSVENRTFKARIETQSAVIAAYLDNRISYREAKGGGENAEDRQ